MKLLCLVLIIAVCYISIQLTTARHEIRYLKGISTEAEFDQTYDNGYGQGYYDGQKEPKP